MQFQKATKQSSRLRLAIAGPSGSGKTFTALGIASVLAEHFESRVALIDTEHGSASKYADRFDFDTLELEAPFHPDRYVEAIAAAAQAGYRVLVIDSLSHAWNGTGGLLEIVDQLAAKQRGSGNKFSAWKDATPIQNRMVEALVAAPVHLIATMRSKQDYVMEKDDRGKTSIQKVGLAPVQRDGVEYEFDIFAEMDMEHRMLITKSRAEALADKVVMKPGRRTAEEIATWLKGSPPPEPTNGQVNGQAKRPASFKGESLYASGVEEVGEAVQSDPYWEDADDGPERPDEEAVAPGQLSLTAETADQEQEASRSAVWAQEVEQMAARAQRYRSEGVEPDALRQTVEDYMASDECTWDERWKGRAREALEAVLRGERDAQQEASV